MSLGFGAGDLIATLKLAKGIYDACKDGPAEYREICSETNSLKNAIQGLRSDARDPNSLLNRKGPGRRKELEEIISNCSRTLRELQAVVDKHSSLQDDSKAAGSFTRIWDAYKLGSSDLDTLRGRLTFHTSTIGVFLLSLEGPAIARIETKLDEIYARLVQHDAVQARHSTTSLTSIASTASFLSQIESNEDDAWAMLKRELLVEGIPMANVVANRNDIIDYIRSLLESGMPSDISRTAAGTHSEAEETQLAVSSLAFSTPSMWSRLPAIQSSAASSQRDSEQTSLGLIAAEDPSITKIRNYSTTMAIVHRAKVKQIIEDLKSLFDNPPFGKLGFEDSGTTTQQLEDYLEEGRELVTSLEEALLSGSKFESDRNRSEMDSWKRMCSKYEQELDELRKGKPMAIPSRTSRGFSGDKLNSSKRTTISSPQFISTTNTQVLEAADLVDSSMGRDGSLAFSKRVSVTRSVPH